MYKTTVLNSYLTLFFIVIGHIISLNSFSNTYDYYGVKFDTSVPAIGSGLTADVFQAVGNDELILKILKKTGMSQAEKESDYQLDLDRFLDMKKLGLVDDKFIVNKLINQHDNSTVGLVKTRVVGTTLRKYFDDINFWKGTKKNKQEEKIKEDLKDMMVSLIQKGIFIADLKPENIMWDERKRRLQVVDTSNISPTAPINMVIDKFKMDWGEDDYHYLYKGRPTIVKRKERWTGNYPPDHKNEIIKFMQQVFDEAQGILINPTCQVNVGPAPGVPAVAQMVSSVVANLSGIASATSNPAGSQSLSYKAKIADEFDKIIHLNIEKLINVTFDKTIRDFLKDEDDKRRPGKYMDRIKGNLLHILENKGIPKTYVEFAVSSMVEATNAVQLSRNSALSFKDQIHQEFNHALKNKMLGDISSYKKILTDADSAINTNLVNDGLKYGQRILKMIEDKSKNDPNISPEWTNFVKDNFNLAINNVK